MSDTRPSDPLELFARCLSDVRDAILYAPPPAFEKSVVPKGLRDSDLGYPNSDHEMDVGMEEALRRGETAHHSAWNFWGVLWFAEGLFHEEIWQNRVPVEVLSGPDLGALIAAANAKWGDE